MIMEIKELDENLVYILKQLLQPENHIFVGDAVMVVGGDGIVRFVSDTYHLRFDIPKGYCEGKPIQELAEEGVFYPCITQMVLERKKKISAMQYTRSGKPIQTIGMPVFDEQGEIRYVVCFNSMELTQLEDIKSRFAQLQDALVGQRTPQKKALPGVPDDIIIESPPMESLWEDVLQYAPTRANVLILGETGVGKSRLARAIHEQSRYAEGPFVELNCAAIPDSLMESELFGYEKGSFTGASPKGKMGKIEMANHGTLFLDEVGELSLSAQAALLHVIQNKSIYRIGSTKEVRVDFRLITATNQVLEESVREKKFRSDLYYRLNVLKLVLPPLRERKEDIVPMALHFLAYYNREYGKDIHFSPKLLEVLHDSYWPGNIRELGNFVERLVIMGKEGEVTSWGTQSLIKTRNDTAGGEEILPNEKGNLLSAPLKVQLETLEERIIRQAYEKCGTTIGVAKLLQISQPTAVRKIHKYIENL